MTETEAMLRSALEETLKALQKIDRFPWLNKVRDDIEIRTLLDECRSAMRTAYDALRD